MAIDHAIPELDGRGLRHFGLTTGAIVAVLFGLLFPWLLERGLPWWPWAIAAPLWALALAFPPWLRPIYRGWMRFGLLASRVMTPLILGILFFLVISPFALFRRLFGSDALHRRFERDDKSYRIPSHKTDLDRLEKPF